MKYWKNTFDDEDDNSMSHSDCVSNSGNVTLQEMNRRLKDNNKNPKRSERGDKHKRNK